ISDSRRSLVLLDFWAVSGAVEFLSCERLAGITSVGLEISLGTVYPVGGHPDVGRADHFIDGFRGSGAFAMLVVVEFHDPAGNHLVTEELYHALGSGVVVNIHAHEAEHCLRGDVERAGHESGNDDGERAASAHHFHAGIGVAAFRMRHGIVEFAWLWMPEEGIEQPQSCSARHALVDVFGHFAAPHTAFGVIAGKASDGFEHFIEHGDSWLVVHLRFLGALLLCAAFSRAALSGKPLPSSSRAAARWPALPAKIFRL